MTNATKPPFDNQTARAAIANALQIELANEIQGKGIPQIANGPFAPGSLGYVEDTGMPRGRRGDEAAAPRRAVRGRDGPAVRVPDHRHARARHPGLGAARRPVLRGRGHGREHHDASTSPR